jgi:hypothetical protein
MQGVLLSIEVNLPQITDEAKLNFQKRICASVINASRTEGVGKYKQADTTTAVCGSLPMTKPLVTNVIGHGWDGEGSIPHSCRDFSP